MEAAGKSEKKKEKKRVINSVSVEESNLYLLSLSSHLPSTLKRDTISDLVRYSGLFLFPENRIFRAVPTPCT